MFTIARLKLTAWYVIITMLITIPFSLIIYNQTYITIEHLSHFMQTDKAVFLKQLHVADLTSSDAFQHFRAVLIIVDFFVFFLSGAAGYFLAGRTLKPIEENMEEQKRFVTDASHEFRTPLTALKTSIEVTMHDKEFESPKVQNLLQRNIYQIDKLQQLANSLLTLAQYHKLQKVHYSSIFLRSVLHESLTKVKSLANAKKIAIHIDIKDAQLFGEKESFIELFTILLDNAVKYSHKNTAITIQSSLERDFVAITVYDEGIGITKKDIPHIFDRFYRSDASRSGQAANGFGLGLSIAKRIVEMNNGKINVTSEEGKGSTFTVQLPLNK